MTYTTVRLHPSVLHDDADFLLNNLRPEDAFELSCSGSSREDVHRAVEASMADYTVMYKNKPAFAFGFIIVGHTAHAWGFGTKDARKCIPAITRKLVGYVFPTLFKRQGVRRIEVRVPNKSTAAIAWLTGALAGTVECSSVHDAAANGATMTQIAFTTKNFEREYKHVFRKSAALPNTHDHHA